MPAKKLSKKCKKGEIKRSGYNRKTKSKKHILNQVVLKIEVILEKVLKYMLN